MFELVGNSEQATASPLPGRGELATSPITLQPGDMRIYNTFREVAVALADGRELDAILHLLPEKLLELTGTNRCSIHLLDEESGLLRGASAAPLDLDPEVKQLISGLPHDHLTQEILATKRPVVIEDTLKDPRPIRSAMLRWNIRSLLCVPMLLRDAVIGIVVLDNKSTKRRFSAADQELAFIFAHLAATAIEQAQLTKKLRTSLTNAANHVEQLRQAAAVEEQLSEMLLRGSTLRDISESMSRLLTKPCAIYDSSFRQLALSRPPGLGGDSTSRLIDKELLRVPKVAEILARLDSGKPEVIEPHPSLGLHHRLLIAAIMLDGDCVGYVVVAEHGRRLRAIDEVVLRRAALNIALERSGERRAGEIEWHTIESFTSSLLRGGEPVAALEKRAETLGLRIDVPRVVCVVAPQQAQQAGKGLELSPKALAKMFTDRSSPSAVIAAPSGHDIALILELPDGIGPLRRTAWAKNRVHEALDEFPNNDSVFAAISTVVRAPGDDSKAYEEALQVLSCMRNHLATAENEVLAVDDLGAGRLLLTSVKPSDALRFAHDVLGPLLAADDAKAQMLLTTLRAFLNAGNSVRRSARQLGVHTNTIRYRMTRIERLTGLAVATDTDDQLTAHLAMLILWLNGQLTQTPMLAGTEDESSLGEYSLDDEGYD